jgi:hypothetical protein
VLSLPVAVWEVGMVFTSLTPLVNYQKYLGSEKFHYMILQENNSTAEFCLISRWRDD